MNIISAFLTFLLWNFKNARQTCFLFTNVDIMDISSRNVGKIIESLLFHISIFIPLRLFYLTHVLLFIATARAERDRTEVEETRCGKLQR